MHNDKNNIKKIHKNIGKKFYKKQSQKSDTIYIIFKKCARKIFGTYFLIDFLKC